MFQAMPELELQAPLQRPESDYQADNGDWSSGFLETLRAPFTSLTIALGKVTEQMLYEDEIFNYYRITELLFT